MKIVDQIISLGEMLTEERNTAHDLWTWLPSYKVAKKHHGDYVGTVCPSPRDVMVEATMFVISKVSEPSLGEEMVAKEWFERCPCGESHD